MTVSYFYFLPYLIIFALKKRQDMIKATKPTSPLFTSELDTFSFSIGGDSATVTITCAGEELLSETYYPVSGNLCNV